MAKKVKLVAPNGEAITDTLETVPATAYIGSGPYLKDADIDFDHAGQTDIEWSDQETVRVRGKRLFQDEGGAIWREDELLPEGSDKIDPAAHATVGPNLPSYNDLLTIIANVYDALAAVPIEMRGAVLQIVQGIEKSGVPL